MTTFDWSLYLAFAKTLLENQDEAKLRSAISRSYYAAFHRAQSYVKVKFPQVRLTGRGDDHGLVWDALKNERGVTREQRSAGEWGNRLLQQRRNADYRSEFPGSLQDEARVATQRAEKVIDLLQEW